MGSRLINNHEVKIVYDRVYFDEAEKMLLEITENHFGKDRSRGMRGRIRKKREEVSGHSVETNPLFILTQRTL